MKIWYILSSCFDRSVEDYMYVGDCKRRTAIYSTHTVKWFAMPNLFLSASFCMWKITWCFFNEGKRRLTENKSFNASAVNKDKSGQIKIGNLCQHQLLLWGLLQFSCLSWWSLVVHLAFRPKRSMWHILKPRRGISSQRNIVQ